MLYAIAGAAVMLILVAVIVVAGGLHAIDRVLAVVFGE